MYVRLTGDLKLYRGLNVSVCGCRCLSMAALWRMSDLSTVYLEW